jgi:HEPN domain-containing protein
MDTDDVREWFQIADDDFYSAQILNEQVRKPYEIICYHCAQAVEKYLKGYLVYKNEVPEKTHNLTYLGRICIDKDIDFAYVKFEFDFLNRYANDIRYPHKYEVNASDVNFAISAVEKIRCLKPIVDIKKIINDKKYEIIE